MQRGLGRFGEQNSKQNGEQTVEWRMQRWKQRGVHFKIEKKKFIF